MDEWVWVESPYTQGRIVTTFEAEASGRPRLQKEQIGDMRLRFDRSDLTWTVTQNGTQIRSGTGNYPDLS